MPSHCTVKIRGTKKAPLLRRIILKNGVFHVTNPYRHMTAATSASLRHVACDLSVTVAYRPAGGGPRGRSRRYGT